MERIPLDHLSRDELIPLIERLFDRLDALERQNAELTKRVEKQARRIEELEKRHPTVRLDESYSMKSEEQRRADAAGKKHKQKSKRRGRISTAEKLAQATRQVNVWPSQYSLEDCQWKYSRPVCRIINGRAVRVAYHIHAGIDGRVPPI